MKKIDETVIYKPKLDQENLDYFQQFRHSGEEIKMSFFYMSDKHMIATPPYHGDTIDKIIKILKGTGICKITITFLNKNL